MSNLRSSKSSRQLVARLLACSLAMSAGALAAGGAVAQTVTASSSLSQAITSFKADPDLFLQQNPVGGAEMVSRTREMTLNDQTVLDSMIALIAKANKEQKAAIASGLAQAARIAVRGNEAYATRIQQAVANTKDPDAVTAYAAASGDTAIAAAGAAGAGSAGASGGQTNALGTAGAGGGIAEGINGNSVGTGNFSFTSSVSGLGGTTTGSTSTTTIINTVSP